MRIDGRDPPALTTGADAGVRGGDETPHPRHVYVHVPFCARRCSYCNFAIAVRRSVPVGAYVTGVARELALRYPTRPDPWRVDTLYLGGGTPSALGGAGVGQLMGALTADMVLGADAEVTIEANPEDVTEMACIAWREAGITRLSIGAQSFDQQALDWMHRSHSGARVCEAVQIARDAGFDRMSIDLILGLPTQLGRSWQDDLDRALALRVDHLSLYGLTVESGTPLRRWIDRGIAAEAPEEAYEEEYLAAHDQLTAAGYEHYEVSNFALPGARARHNSAYWAGVPYAGLGPAAHGFDGRVRRWNASSYTEWERLVTGGEDPVAGAEQLTSANHLEERVYLELRTAAGTVLDARETGMAAAWVTAGWARLSENRLRLTSSGWLRLDALAVALANVRSQ
jgi:oxygen-independent coproporphyrinogen III oxidase